MVFNVKFSDTEIQQLYLTYRKNSKNYEEIKKRLFGDAAKIEFRRNLRGRRNFIFALTGVAVISSFYSIFAEHWGSLGAIWIIWAAFALGLAVAMYLSYKDSFLVIQRNEAFFQNFEKIAAAAPTLEDFMIDWKRQ